MEENLYSKVCIECGSEYIGKGKVPVGTCPECVASKLGKDNDE